MAPREFVYTVETPMKAIIVNLSAAYMHEVEQLLTALYGITLEDTGLSVEEWLERFGDEPAPEAVEAFAVNFDLTPLSSGAFMPFQK